MNLPNDKDLMKTPWNDSVPTVTLKIKEIDEVFKDINNYNDYWLDSREIPNLHKLFIEFLMVRDISEYWELLSCD